MVGDSEATPRHAGFRYGAAFVLTLLVVMVAIVAPAGELMRATVLALESAALVVVVATSRARAEVRRKWGLLARGPGRCSPSASWRASSPRRSCTSARGSRPRDPVALAGGLVRLVRMRGATLQAVAGALTIYLCLGLTFAWIIGVVSRFGSGPYFTNGTDGTESDRVYFSFTVLTTTGFGDFTAATQFGHSLAVLEMLIGQLYLVTVIGVLVGSFARR